MKLAEKLRALYATLPAPGAHNARIIKDAADALEAAERLAAAASGLSVVGQIDEYLVVDGMGAFEDALADYRAKTGGDK